MITHWESLAFAHGKPIVSGILKAEPQDFRVDEILGLEPDGTGEHLCVLVRATGQNTAFIVGALAKWAGVPKSLVSYSGLKDRHAVTTQWFSIHLPGRQDPEPTHFDGRDCEILALKRHSRKIRTGTHWGNQFEIVVRQLQFPDEDARALLLARLSLIDSLGVPNYFGAQRFGLKESNLSRALEAVKTGRLPRDRDERGWIFSALRSYLFNIWLCERVSRGCWREWLTGDLLQRRARRGFFVADQLDEETANRLYAGELVPAGILPGEGENPMQSEARHLADGVWAPHHDALEFLRKHRLSTEVRSAVLLAENFQYDLDANNLWLRFSLPKGSFATALLREIIVDVGFRHG